MTDPMLVALVRRIIALSPAERADFYAMMAASPGVSPRLLSALRTLCAPGEVGQ